MTFQEYCYIRAAKALVNVHHKANPQVSGVIKDYFSETGSDRITVTKQGLVREEHPEYTMEQFMLMHSSDLVIDKVRVSKDVGHFVLLELEATFGSIVETY